MESDFSSEFAKLCEVTGYEWFTLVSGAEGIANNGGESRFFLRVAAKGWVEVHNSEQGRPVTFEFAGATTELVERYFWSTLDMTYRSRHRPRLPRLQYPPAPERLPDGYTRIPAGAGQAFDLLLRHGLPIAHLSRDEELWTAAGYCAYLDHPIPLIRASLDDPEGKPLFSIR